MRKLLPTNKVKGKVKVSQNKKNNLFAPIFSLIYDLFDNISNYFWKQYYEHYQE